MKKLIYKIKGEDVTCVSIRGFSEMCGKRSTTLRKWEREGLLPPANFRTPEVPLSNGRQRPGTRLYTLELATKVAAIVKSELKQGIPFKDDTWYRIKELFKEERQKLT